jgi:hypothetical protein
MAWCKSLLAIATNRLVTRILLLFLGGMVGWNNDRFTLFCNRVPSLEKRLIRVRYILIYTGTQRIQMQMRLSVCSLII